MRRLERALPDLADRLGDRVALVGESGASITYRELERLALGCAARLRGAGVGAGDSVVVLTPNTISFVASFFGALMAGAVVTTLSPDSTRAELAAMIDATRPVAAVLVRASKDRDYDAELDDVLPELRVFIEGADSPGWQPSEDRGVIVDRDPDEAAFVAFTSGSTGQPKGAVHRAVTLVRTGEFYLEHVVGGEAMTTPATFPLYHLGGLTLILLPALFGGGTVVMMEGFRVPALVDTIERYRVDHIAAIPAMMELLFLRANVDEHDMSSLRWVMLSGAPVTNTLARQVHDRLGATVFVGYGQTECPGTNVMTRADTPVDEVGPMVGWPVDGYEVGILDETAAQLPAGSLGEVCIRSHYRMLRYTRDPQGTAAAIDAHGWLHMGDLGELRDDGALIIRGRKKEMYIRGGFNVYPVEVEAVLVSHPAVSLAAVHAIADPVLGERGVAWVVPEPGSTVTAGVLREFAAQTLAYYKLPDVINVVPELPMSAVGKVDKLALQRLADA